MWTRRQALLAKGVIALALCAALAAVVLPLLLSVYDRSWPDNGARPLIIIATQGGEVDYTARVDAEVDADGDFRFRFHIESATLEDSGTPRAAARFQILVIGEDLEGRVHCGGPESTLEAIGTDDLDPGPQHAYRVDVISGGFSATNYGDSLSDDVASPAGDGVTVPTPSPPVPAADGPAVGVLRHTGEVMGWYEDEDPYDGRSVDDEGRVWVEECTVDSSLVWASSAGTDDPLSGAEATLLAPQFNLTSIDGVTDHQADLWVDLWVDRVDGATIVEAFPAPEAHASGWSLVYDTRYQGGLGSEHSFMYTEQPTWLITNREAARDEQTLLLFGGMGLGLALTLVVRGLSDLVDAGVRDGQPPPQPRGG